MRREIKIGLTAVVAHVVLFFGIKFLKGVNLTGQSNAFYITFANAKGLAKSSTVYADGYKVGIVDDIEYVRPGCVVVRVAVESGVKIPHGTLCQLDEAMLGGCTLNMIMGPNPANCFAPGDTLRGASASGLMDGAAALMPQLSQVMSNVDSLVTALNKVVSDPAIQALLHNTEALTGSLNESSEQLGTLLGTDLPEMLSIYSQTGRNLDTLTASLSRLDLEGTLGKVDNTMDNLNEATARLTNPDNNVGMLLTDTALYGNLTTTMENAGELLGDLKAHPSRYINVTVFGGRKKKADE